MAEKIISCSVCLAVIIYGYEIIQNGQTIIEYGYSIDSGGREMKKTIMNDIRKIKCFLFVSLVMVLLGCLLSTPLHEDEDFIFQNILMRKWFGGIEFIGLIISMLYCGITCYYLTSSVLLMAHAVYNVTFQFQLLRKNLERESEKFNDSNIIYEEQRQRKIHEFLTRFVRYHLKIKKTIDELFRGFSVVIPLLSSTGVIAVATVVYFIKAGIYPSHNFRMVYFTFMAGMVLIALSYFGQILSDESSRLYDQLNICDWINWNQSNRRHLLIILPAIAEPITLSCPGLVDVDLRLLLFVCRGIYTVFTALMNMHN